MVWIWNKLKPGFWLLILTLANSLLGVVYLSLSTIEELELLRQLGRNGYAYIGFCSAAAMTLSLSIVLIISNWNRG